MSSYERYRTRGQLSTTQNDITWYRGNADCAHLGLYFYSNETCNAKKGNFQTMQDVVTSGFRAKVRKGEVINNSMSRFTQIVSGIGSSSYGLQGKPPGALPSCVCGGVPYYIQWLGVGPVFAQTWVYHVKQVFEENWPDFPGYLTNGRDLATEIWTKCLANVGSLTQTNLLESFAEMDQAWHMMLNPLENLRSFHSKFVRDSSGKGRYRRIRKLGKTILLFVSAEWLRYRYGVRPLISDVNAALAALKTTYRPVKERFTTRAFGSIEVRASDAGTFDYDQVHVNWRRDKFRTKSVRAWHLDEYRRTPWDDLGINLQNIIGLPWELTNKSFVVDWFANIGDLIYANVPRAGVDSLGGGIVEKDRLETVVQPTGCTLINPANYTLTGGLTDGLVAVSEKIDRTPMSGFGGLVVRTDFRLDNYTRCTDLVAIISQQLARIHF